MQLIVAAFWVHDEDVEDAMRMVTSDPVPGISGSGAAVQFGVKQASDWEFRRTLRRFNLQEAADYEPPDLR